MSIKVDNESHQTGILIINTILKVKYSGFVKTENNGQIILVSS